MREIWAPVWFATALCAIALIATVLYKWEPAAPAFFSFLPVVFLQMGRSIQGLHRRIEDLERSQEQDEHGV